MKFLDLSESMLILLVAGLLLFSIIRFIKAFYKNTLVSLELIKLSKRGNRLMEFLFSLNLIFLISIIFNIIIANGAYHIDLLGILIYIIGVAIFLNVFVSIIRNKPYLR